MSDIEMILDDDECSKKSMEGACESITSKIQVLRRSFRGKKKRESTQKLECEWVNLTATLKELKSEEILIVNNCPSIEQIVSNGDNFVNNFFTKNENTIALHIKVNEPNLIITEHHQYDIIPQLKNVKKTFLTLFESTVDNSSVFYWRLKDKKAISKLTIESLDFRIGEITKEFIINALKDNNTCLHRKIIIPPDCLILDTTFNMLSCYQSHNPLFYASEIGNVEATSFMLNHFDVNQEIDEICAIDLALKGGHFEVIYKLLMANSRFPSGLGENFREFPIALTKFIITSKTMHDAIRTENAEKVSQIIAKNPGLRYFFNLNNQSALSFALEKRAFGIYKLLIAKNISLGPHEKFRRIIETFTAEERNELSELNLKNVSHVAKKYILKLLGNSNVGPDDELKETRCEHVLKAFECLNKIEEIRPLLKFTAAQKSFQLIFDFNRSHVQFLDPNSEYYVTGLFYFSGKIYIGAKYLLDEEKAHEVYGVIAHEICHFVMFKVYDNYSKPYAFKDTITAQNFQKIADYCEVLFNFDDIVTWVFTKYAKNQQHAELIVRIPHLLGHYHNNPERLEDIKETLCELYSFYTDHCLKAVNNRLERGRDEPDSSIGYNNQGFEGNVLVSEVTCNKNHFNAEQQKPAIYYEHQYVDIDKPDKSDTQLQNDNLHKCQFEKYLNIFAPRVIGLLMAMVICLIISGAYDNIKIGTYYYFIIFPIIFLLLAKANFYFQREYSKSKTKPRGTSEFFKINSPLMLSLLLLSLLVIVYCYLVVKEGIKVKCEEEKDARYCKNVTKICESDEDEEYECDALNSLDTCLTIWICFSLFLLMLRPCLNFKNKMMEIRAQPGSVTKYFAMCTPWKIVYTLFFVVLFVIMIIYLKCNADRKCDLILGWGFIFTIILLILCIVRLILHLPREYVKVRGTPGEKTKFLNICLSWVFVILLTALGGIMLMLFCFERGDDERSTCFYWALTCILLMALIIGVKFIMCLQNKCNELETSMENAAKSLAWQIAIALTAVLFGILITVHLVDLYDHALIRTIPPIYYYIYSIYFIVFLISIRLMFGLDILFENMKKIYKYIVGKVLCFK